MKRIIFVHLAISMLMISSLGNSQTSSKPDEIFLKNNTSVKGKVLRVTDSNIEIDPEGQIPFQIVSRSDCLMILYSNGTFVNFANSTETTSILNNKQAKEDGFYDEAGNNLYYLRVVCSPLVEIMTVSEYNNLVQGSKVIKYIDNGEEYSCLIVAGINMNTKFYVKGLNLGIVAAGANSVSILPNYSILIKLFNSGTVSDAAKEMVSGDIDGGTLENGGPPYTRQMDEIKIVMNKNYSQVLPAVNFRDFKIIPTMRITDWTMNDRAKLGNKLAATFAVEVELNISSN